MLALHCNVGSLFLLYRYDFSFCSWKLAVHEPPLLARPYNTQQAAAPHEYYEAVGNSRVGHFETYFFLLHLEALKLSTLSCLSHNYNLAHFKKDFHIQNFQKFSLAFIFFYPFINLSIFQLGLASIRLLSLTGASNVKEKKEKKSHN